LHTGGLDHFDIRMRSVRDARTRRTRPTPVLRANEGGTERKRNIERQASGDAREQVGVRNAIGRDVTTRWSQLAV
jgi:hypothetical protein